MAHQQKAYRPVYSTKHLRTNYTSCVKQALQRRHTGTRHSDPDQPLIHDEPGP
ncbi:hypothetical protein DSUL_20233 [Desulfovibrionales bacterium]